MHWDDLRVFLAVARGESLTRAGVTLRLDPATVGRRIERLERDSDARLFLRSPQGYALTEDGQGLLAHAERVEAAVLAGRVQLEGRTSGLAGTIRLGAPDGCANFLLPGVIAQICADHPDLRVEIVALPRIFNLTRREADLAITVSEPESARLETRTLANYRLHLVGARSYLDRSPPIRTRDDLSRHRILGYIPDMIFDRELDYLREVGRDGAPDIGSNSASVQMHLARAGAGLVIAHDFALPFLPDLQKVLAEEISLERRFHLVRHRDDRNDGRIGRFAALLEAGVAAEVTRLEQLT